MRPSGSLNAALAKYPVAGAAYLSLNFVVFACLLLKMGTPNSYCVRYKLIILVVCAQIKLYRLLVLPLIEIWFQTVEAADELGRVCHPEHGYNQHAQSFLVSALSSHLKWLRNTKIFKTKITHENLTKTEVACFVFA